MADDKSIFDLAVDELLERQKLTTVELHKRFKGTRPFRTEKMSDEDRLAEYHQWANTPMEAELRAKVGDAEIDQIHVNMHELENKRMMDNARL